MSRTARILIVDDEPNVRLVFRTALESSGYAVSDGRGRGDGPAVARERRRSTSSCSTSRCPASAAWRCSGGSATRATTSRS